jgi:hypothetical protein
MSAGKSFNRSPSDQSLESGDIFSSLRPMSLSTPHPTGHISILWRMAWVSSVMKRRT